MHDLCRPDDENDEDADEAHMILKMSMTPVRIIIITTIITIITIIITISMTTMMLMPG